MNEKTFSEITDERLADWGEKIKKLNSTPLLLISIGHEQNSGEFHVCVPGDIDDAFLAAALRWVLKGIEQGAVPKKEGETREFKPKP